MKIKSLASSLSLIVAAFLLGGCQLKIQNLTPTMIPVNPSGIYTFSFEVNTFQQNIVPGTLAAAIVINEQELPMTLKPGSNNTYFCDFNMPETQNEVKYYYKITYDYIQEGETRKAVKYSTQLTDNAPYVTRMISQYVDMMGSSRGPVGAMIPIVGSGFSEFDEIFLGDTKVESKFVSSTNLVFKVPAIESGVAYPVVVRTGKGRIEAGSFFVDAAKLSVLPAEIKMQTGERTMLVVKIDMDAPMSGLPVDAKTNVPASVIMPVVKIPEGARSVNVTVEGGKAGSGVIEFSAPGYMKIQIPVTIY
jgi:hypothetical protein